MNAVIDYLPSPIDVPPIEGEVSNPKKRKSSKKEEAQQVDRVVRHADDKEPFSALAFKVASHDTVDKLVYCRVYSGTLKRGEVVYNVATEKRERVNRILQDACKQRREL